MLKSEYLAKFQKFKGASPEGKLYGNRIILEMFQDDTVERKSAGGIILAESEHAKSGFGLLKSTIGIVLEVGEGYFDPDTKEDVPLELAIGNVVWIPEQSVRYLTTMPGLKEGIPKKKLALASEGEIIKSWNSIEEYQQDCEKLNG